MKNTVFAGPVVRRLRRRRRVALPGEARDPLVLVSDLARAAGGARARQPLLDAPADGLSVEASLDDRAAIRPRHHPHEHALVPDRRAVRAGPEEAQAVGADRHGRREGRGRSAGSLAATEAIDFVCREEFDFTCKEVAEGKPLARSWG
jgi:hypothetical protein